MSENVEPEHILLHADWSTTRHDEYPPDADVVEHERQRHEKLRRGRAPFMPPSSPEEAERLMDAVGGPEKAAALLKEHTA